MSIKKIESLFGGLYKLFTTVMAATLATVLVATPIVLFAQSGNALFLLFWSLYLVVGVLCMLIFCPQTRGYKMMIIKWGIYAIISPFFLVLGIGGDRQSFAEFMSDDSTLEGVSR